MAEIIQPDIVKHYIKSQPEKTAAALKEAIGAIYDAAPNAVAVMNYGILAFALVPGGKREEQVMVAGYAKHIGFYPHPTAIEHFKAELQGKYKFSKGSVQFPLTESVPRDLIVRMVRYRKGLLDEGK